LQALIYGLPPTAPFRQLLVGTDTSDDAAVWQIDDANCVIASTDFFMPMVDDPYDFGRIAATNAISDVYAMGGRPILALAILGMPVGKIPLDDVRAILKGGSSICATAGIPVAGGHSIDSPEPIYGLAVVGTCRPQNLRRNTGARSGDVLIFTKPIGVGIYSAAIKRGLLSATAYSEMIEITTKLNQVGAELAKDPAVHAMTDVTGFGMLGHALEIARGSKLAVVIGASRVPLLAEAATLAQQGVMTGASKRNWDSYGHEVALPGGIPEWHRQLLTDLQTSGGLLIACRADHAARLLTTVRDAGHAAACIIGHVIEGPPTVRIEI
jgi:selenide,water dikinase